MVDVGPAIGRAKSEGETCTEMYITSSRVIPPTNRACRQVRSDVIVKFTEPYLHLNYLIELMLDTTMIKIYWHVSVDPT